MALVTDIADELIRADSERSQALAAERAALRGSSPAPASPGLEK